MNMEYEELHDEADAITAAVSWAVSDHGIDWPQLAGMLDGFADNLTAVNSRRRRAVRSALLRARGRTDVEGRADDDQDESSSNTTELAIGDLSRMLRLVAGKLPPAAHGLIRYLSEHPEGASALRDWFRHVGFSNGEITWLFKELEAVDHGFFRMLESGGELDTLLNHAYCGDDMARVGFLSVESAEVPETLDRMVGRFAAKGVTPCLFHTIPVVVAMAYLADWKDEDLKISHPSYQDTVLMAVGARGNCYNNRNCSGVPIARNVTRATCKRKTGKSLYTGGRCIKV